MALPGGKLALLYGYEPSGHYMAAKALFETLSKERQSIMVNLSEIYPYMGPFVATTYFKLIQKTPSLWGYLYDSPYLSFAHSNLKSLIPGIFFLRIKKLLTENRVCAVICTHAFASLLASREFIGLPHIKRYCVLTDLSAHSFWDKNADAYFVPSAWTKKTLTEKKIREEKIFITGMPLRGELISASRLRHRAANSAPVFLLTGGNRGLMAFDEIKNAFLKSAKRAHLNVLCGENKKLKKTRDKEGSVTFSFFPYQNDVSALYSSCDCVIGKPGGLTIFETALFSKPLIAHSPLPGQEERNLAFLEKSRRCFYASGEKELCELINLFYRNKKAFSQRAENLSSLSRPDACRDIVEKILV